MKAWIASENMVGRTNNYLVPRRRFGTNDAVFSPKGNDGFRAMVFYLVTGKIDQDIAKQWEKHGLKKVLEKNWVIPGPKLQGKIWIWMGDMDNLYSNVATRFLKEFPVNTENPKSEVKISFTRWLVISTCGTIKPR